MKKEYEVYLKKMRHAEVYIDDPGVLPPDMDSWVDFRGDPLLDIVYAEDEADACDVASMDTGFHPASMYAIQHVCSARLDKSETSKRRIEASACSDDDKCGIEVTLPNGTNILVWVDKTTEKVSIDIPKGMNVSILDKLNSEK